MDHDAPRHEGTGGLPNLGEPAMLNAAKRRRWREGPLAEIINIGELRAWLQTQPREVAVAFAARAALRVLPIVQDALNGALLGDFFADIVLPVFHAADVAWATAKYPVQATEFRKAARDADALAVRASSVASARDAAAFAAYAAAGAARAAVDDFFAADAAASAFAAFATFAARAAHAAFWDAVSTDATRVEEGVAASNIARSPLWPQPQGQPDQLQSLWQEMKAALHAAKQDWQVWTIWYDDRLAGRVGDEERELAFVNIDEALWAQGPAAVNNEIRKRIGELEPWTNSLGNLPEVPLGNKWIEKDDRLAIDPAGQETDDVAARDLVVCQLHEAVKRKARAFADAEAGIDERLGWTGFDDAIGRFLTAVDVATAAIPSRIAAVYDATIELASFIDVDSDLRLRPGTLNSPAIAIA